MAEVRELPDRAVAEREASEWLARLGADDVSDSDRAAFATWQAATPVNVRAFEELCSTWREFEAAGPVVRAVAFGQSMIEAGAPARTKYVRWTIAAGLAAVLTAAGGWFVTHRPTESFQTAVGEQAAITMPDGSIVELNGNSSARTDYSKARRVIWLERGEAFFKVAHDERRPFWVVADETEVRAVGTAFNVDIRPTGVRVTVDEGTIKVKRADQERVAMTEPGDVASTILRAGEEVEVRAEALEVRRVRPVDIARSTSWRRGALEFENEPLQDVVAELRHYTSLNVVILDGAIANLQVGGSFQASAQGADALIAMLHDGLGLGVEREGDTVYVSSPSRH